MKAQEGNTMEESIYDEYIHWFFGYPNMGMVLLLVLVLIFVLLLILFGSNVKVRVIKKNYKYIGVMKFHITFRRIF